MRKFQDRIFIALPYLIIGFIVVCSFLSAYGMSFLGDDLNHGIRTHEKFPNWYQWPLIIPYQWLTGNGRFGDMIGNLLLAEAPMWLLASLSGIMEGLFYFMAIKLSFPNKKAVLPRLIIISIIIFTFPWWDSFFLFVCRINYIWTTALILFVLWITLFQHNNITTKWGWILVPIALMAGWGHEAAGMPIVIGLIIYFFFFRKFNTLPTLNRITIVAFIVGSLFSITSPRSYSRLGADSIPDDTVPMLILKSSFLVVALLFILGIILCTKAGRHKVAQLCTTPWIVLAIGAICSTLFVAIGGVVGRSGLFSQTYALIAIGILIRNLISSKNLNTNTISTILSILLFLLITTHEIGVCMYQIKGNRELKQCLMLYEQSNDGVIYASPMQRNQFPWWTLNKNKACVDNDDFWFIEVYDLRIGKNKKHYRLLPDVLKDFDENTTQFNEYLKEGYVVRDMPLNNNSDSNIITQHGKQYTVVEFTSKNGQPFLYVSPRIVDPGDR